MEHYFSAIFNSKYLESQRLKLCSLFKCIKVFSLTYVEERKLEQVFAIPSKYLKIFGLTTWMIDFLGGSVVKNSPALEMQEMQVQSLLWKDLLEKEMATHSSILAWKIPWTEEPGGLVHGVSKSQM